MAISILLPLGLALAVLAATSDTSASPPQWFAQAAPPSTGSGPTEPTAPNAAALSTTTTTSTPAAPVAAPSPPPAAPVPTPPPTSAPVAGPAGSWRLVLPLGTSATSDLADVAAATISDIRVLVAAGGDAGGPLVLASADDGASWRLLPRAGLPASGAARSVAADRDRVAVVVADADGSTVWELRRERWTQAAMEGGDDGRRAVSTVALHEGVLVAAGFDPAASGFWVEQDAGRLVRATARGPSPVPAGGNVAFDLTSSSAGLVAAGRMGDAAMRWTSTDGRIWHGVALPAPTSAAATALTAAGQVAAGYDASGGLLWRLSQGEWVLLRLPPPTDR
ncbi:MAG TPA: hypothetical protein VFV35_03100, partial [Acidimicrobiales bacterium]|nr:hypothetical protein [Acidimicrobiales bacterium]